MQTWIKSSAKLFNWADLSNFKGFRTGTNNDLRWSVSHQSVTGYIPLPCTNKTLHGWEEGSHSDCCTQSVTALHKSSGIYLAFSPSLSKKILLWFPRSQHVSCSTLSTFTTPEFHFAISGNSGEEGDFHSASKSVFYFHTGPLAHSCLRSQSFKVAHGGSIIRGKPDVLWLVCGTFCSSITHKLSSMLTRLKLIQTLEVSFLQQHMGNEMRFKVFK